MHRFLVFVLSIFITAGSFAEELSAYESVKQSTEVLLKRLVEVQPVYESDPETFFREVEGALEPHIDFESFAKGVMAKHYRKATPEQKALFKEQFKTALIRTYAKALVEFDNQKVEVLEPDTPQKRPDRASILLEVHAKSGTTYPVHYQLGLQDGSWLLRNVIINGINMGLQFRSQFNGYMQKHRGDVDKVIENWTVDVESNQNSA